MKRPQIVLFFLLFTQISYANICDELLGYPISRSLFVKAKMQLLANVMHPDVKPGAIIASPSRHAPDYFFTWTRDAALVLEVLLEMQARTDNVGDYEFYDGLIRNVANFTREIQRVDSLTGLGEPKYNVDGSAFFDEWGRPQNDGPALRAIAFIKYANRLIEKGQVEYVRNHLFSKSFKARSIIKTDLEYISHRIYEHSYDYWEEVKGIHFNVLLAQHTALVEGAKLARYFEDLNAALWYEDRARHLEVLIEAHWDGERNQINITSGRSAGLDYKLSGLDVATLLGVLHSSSFSISDERLLATVHKIKKVFVEMYRVNEETYLGVGIGRYPEDNYNGYHTYGKGNPWFLATAAFAEFHYKLATEILTNKKVYITKRNFEFYTDLFPGWKLSPGLVITGDELPRLMAVKLEREGDLYLQRIERHVGKNGQMDEQFHRDDGIMAGARDLTWSYASLITASWVKQDLVNLKNSTMKD